MVYLFIFFVILLALGPVLWFRPTLRDKRLSVLRLAAKSEGLELQVVNVGTDKTYGPIAERNPEITHVKWMRYRLSAKGGQRAQGMTGRWIQRRDRNNDLWWEPDNLDLKESDSVASILEPWRKNQDDRFLALELTPVTASVVWNEEGDADDLADICTGLRRLLSGGDGHASTAGADGPGQGQA